MVTLEGVRRQLGPGVTFYCEHFHADAGAHVALWGPSGCGKSTMLNLVTGLLKPESGVIRVNDTEVQKFGQTEMDEFRGSQFGFVFQTFNLLAPFTALQNVMLAMRFSNKIPRKVWRGRATELLERVGLSHRLNSKPSTMSVGEQQRVAIARALANKQKIIVADEPTGSLDPKTSGIIMDLLLQLCNEDQVTLLLVAHAEDVAGRLEHRFDCHGLVKDETL